MEETMMTKVENFVIASNYSYSRKQILATEKDISTVLSWYLNPPTLNSKVEEFLQKWDVFMGQNSDHHQLPENMSKIVEEEIPREGLSLPGNFIETLPCYKRFRNMTQVLDLLTLDIDTLRYEQNALVLSILF